MRKRRVKRPPHEYIIALVLLVVALWLTYMLIGIVRKEEIARTAADDARRELSALTEREMTLKENLDELQTVRGQEASIRETYGVARPGEEVIIVVPPPEEPPLQELPWWNKFLGFFGL